MVWLQVTGFAVIVVCSVVVWTLTICRLIRYERVVGGMVEAVGYLTDYLDQPEIPTGLSMDDARELEEARS